MIQQAQPVGPDDLRSEIHQHGLAAIEKLRRNADIYQRPILLLGGSGMLGTAFRSFFDAYQIRYAAPSREQLDLSDVRSISANLKRNYSLVVNCSGYTDVDGAETHREDAYVINACGVGLLAEQCFERQIRLVHFSTDYVFNGEANVPYTVNSETDPINLYGRSKLLGEQLIRQSGCSHLIVRTSWLYASWGKNFVRTMCKLVSEKSELSVVDDQRGRPTHAGQLAAAVWRMVLEDVTGTQHVTDGGECTWWTFASAIADELQANCLIRPSTTASLNRPASRPAYSALDTSESESIIGRLPHWQTSLRVAVRSIAAGNSVVTTAAT